MMIYRPLPPTPYWRWRFVWFRRLGDYLAIMEWLRIRYEDAPDGKTFTLTWHNSDLDGDPYLVERFDVPVF